MQFARKTINFLTNIITGKDGDDPRFPRYKKGHELVRFFNDFGFNDIYGKSFSSRWQYTEQRLLELNNNNQIEKAVEHFLNPINFVNDNELLNLWIQELNEYLVYDNYQIKIENKKIKIFSTGDTKIHIDSTPQIDNDFVKENIEKCDDKIGRNDFSGAITNARALLEDVMIYLYNEITNTEFKYNGDLPALYKKLSKN
ncbi:MAG: hypothetical protein ACOZBH_05270 [Patescibacteria group bacterium]